MGRERSGGYADLERRGGGGTRACRGWSHVTCRCECVLWGGWEGRWGFGFVGLRGLGGGGALGEEGLLASVEVEAVAVVLVWLGFDFGGGFGRRVLKTVVGCEGAEGELFALPLEIAGV